MKQFENIFRTLFLAIIGLFISLTTSAQDEVNQSMDSVEIGLLTCSPHEEIYSLYGHTAIRIHDLRNNADWVFNYGVFNFKAPHFASRFVFGLTDYELGVVPTRPFLEYYAEWGSQVTVVTVLRFPASLSCWRVSYFFFKKQIVSQKHHPLCLSVNTSLLGDSAALWTCVSYGVVKYDWPITAAPSH